MASPGEVVGSFLSFLGGGKGQVEAAALSARASQVVQRTRGDILGYLEKAGNRLGAQFGGDYFQALAKGANVGSTNAKDQAAEQYFGVSVTQAREIGGLVGIGLLALVLIMVLRWQK